MVYLRTYGPGHVHRPGLGVLRNRFAPTHLFVPAFIPTTTTECNAQPNCTEVVTQKELFEAVKPDPKPNGLDTSTDRRGKMCTNPHSSWAAESFKQGCAKCEPNHVCGGDGGVGVCSRAGGESRHAPGIHAAGASVRANHGLKDGVSSFYSARFCR